MCGLAYAVFSAAPKMENNVFSIVLKQAPPVQEKNKHYRERMTSSAKGNVTLSR